jgi:hypothetical protein
MQPPTLELVSRPSGRSVQYDTGRAELAGGGSVSLALGYRRAAEFEQGDHPGQDFAVVRAGGGRVVAVVADGVSQSFFGDIAARHLANGVAELLWTRAANPPDAAEMLDALRGMAPAAHAEAETVAIAEHAPDLLRAALERQRPEGSQTVFAAAVFDPAAGTARLYQVGDAVVVLFGAGDDAGTSVPANHPRARWSTRSAAALRLEVRDYAGVRGLVLRSDGASTFGDRWGDAADEGAFRERAEHLAGVDDVSFVAARVEAAAALPPLACVAEREAGPVADEPAPEGASAGPPTPPPARRATDRRRAASPPVPAAGRPERRSPPDIRVVPRARRRTGRTRGAAGAALAVVALTAIIVPLARHRGSAETDQPAERTTVAVSPLQNPEWQTIPPSQDRRLAWARNILAEREARKAGKTFAPQPKPWAADTSTRLPDELMGVVGEHDAPAPHPLDGSDTQVAAAPNGNGPGTREAASPKKDKTNPPQPHSPAQPHPQEAHGDQSHVPTQQPKPDTSRSTTPRAGDTARAQRDRGTTSPTAPAHPAGNGDNPRQGAAGNDSSKARPPAAAGDTAKRAAPTGTPRGRRGETATIRRMSARGSGSGRRAHQRGGKRKQQH